jgi:protein-tyrosine-phosphatase
VDLLPHRSQLVDAERIESADLVVVMDPSQERRIQAGFGKPRAAMLVLADLLPAFGTARMIPDPIEQPPETFERVYSQIDLCLNAMWEVVDGDAQLNPLGRARGP